MAVRSSSLRAGRPLIPGRFVVLISVRGCLTQGHSVAGRIRLIEKPNYLIGNRTRDLSASSIGPRPTTLPCAPSFYCYRKERKKDRQWNAKYTYYSNGNLKLKFKCSSCGCAYWMAILLETQSPDRIRILNILRAEICVYANLMKVFCSMVSVVVQIESKIPSVNVKFLQMRA
jgi:hypothetical protein